MIDAPCESNINTFVEEHLSSEKTPKKENELVIIGIFAIYYYTDKQRNKQYIFFLLYTSSWSTYNTILQYLQDSDHNDDNDINYKSYLRRGPCTPCEKMTHKENLDRRRNHL